MDRYSGGWQLGTNQNHEAGWLSSRNESLHPQMTPTDRQREPWELPGHSQFWLSDCSSHLAGSADSCVGWNSKAPPHELMGGWVPNPAVHGFGMYTLSWPAPVPASRHSKSGCLLLALQSHANSIEGFFSKPAKLCKSLHVHACVCTMLVPCMQAPRMHGLVVCTCLYA